MQRGRISHLYLVPWTGSRLRVCVQSPQASLTSHQGLSEPGVPVAGGGLWLGPVGGGLKLGPDGGLECRGVCRQDGLETGVGVPTPPSALLRTGRSSGQLEGARQQY